ncbi:Os02g0253800, partial [Oryza sativa Japonica Group]
RPRRRWWRGATRRWWGRASRRRSPSASRSVVCEPSSTPTGSSPAPPTPPSIGLTR